MLVQLKSYYIRFLQLGLALADKAVGRLGGEVLPYGPKLAQTCSTRCAVPILIFDP